MTVASLWKALDRAGCGKHVGANELLDHQGTKSKTNPWNFREMHKLSRSQQPVLAVDLSIWICEALGSSAMKDMHVADPALQLVYSRALKLLTLGIKLVVVVEGKRRNRIRTQDHEDKATSKSATQDKFRKRRSGTLFWTACERCETMLKLLGVIVVRAKAEGEALCALLNQKGIVDGVISNDGDCLLFGAKVLYTKFSVENLERSNILRYDANNIRVMVDDDDADRFDETRQTSKDGQNVVELSRKDLIAFAILTGSDLAGEGLSKVGCRKAIRFIRKCQIDNPLRLEGDSSPALEQLLSWENTASTHGNIEDGDVSGPRCGCCGHAGTKRDHKKFGCKGCGTEPGEACFQLSPGGRFRKQLRAKALSMQSSFDPSSTLRAYYEPNENQIPLCLVGKSARKLEMNPPQPEKILQLPFIIRGRSLQESREFVRKSLSVYLARQELLQASNKGTAETEGLAKLPKNRNRPTPVRVSKLVVRSGKPSCEVQWVIKATTSDDKGNPLDEFEFSTIEDESIIQKCHPKLLEVFREEQKKLQQQGTAEQEKRRNFLLSMEKPNDEHVATKKTKTRKDHFEQIENIPKTLAKSRGVSDDVELLMIRDRNKKEVRKEIGKKRGNTDEHIGRMISTKNNDCNENYHIESEPGCQRKDEMFDDSSTICTVEQLQRNRETSPRKNYFSHGMLTPGHEYYLGIESAFQFRRMAGDNYQPRFDCNGMNPIQDKHVAPVESSNGAQDKSRDATTEMFGGREPSSKLYGMESRGPKNVSFAANKENESSFFESSYERRGNATGDGDEIFLRVNTKPNFAKPIEQRGDTPELLPYRYSGQDNEKQFLDEQNSTNEYFPRKRLFLSNGDDCRPTEDRIGVESEELHYHEGRTKSGNPGVGFHPFELPHEKFDKRNHGENERNQARMEVSEERRRFDTDDYQLRFQENRKNWNNDKFQNKSYDFDSCYSLSHKRGKTRERKRHRDVDHHHPRSEFTDDRATCNSWEVDGEPWIFYKDEDATKRAKTFPITNIFHENCEQKHAKRQKKSSRISIRDQVEDESWWLEPNRRYRNRDGLSQPCDIISPSNIMSDFENYGIYENRSICFSRSVGASEDFSVQTFDDREIDYRPEEECVSGQACCCRCRSGYRQYQSRTSKRTSRLRSEIDGTERINIERLVAANFESQNRRARVRLLCSKFIEE